MVLTKGKLENRFYFQVILGINPVTLLSKHRMFSKTGKTSITRKIKHRLQEKYVPLHDKYVSSATKYFNKGN